MITKEDEILLKKKGISTEKMLEQLASFESGFPFLEIKSAAEINNGIVQIKNSEISGILNTWDTYLQSNAKIVKFVPASGAASRMFKDLFEFLESDRLEPIGTFENSFFTNINKFAFFEELNLVCVKNNNLTIDQLILNKQFKSIVENLLSDKGLNYGSLPKGLLRFHAYPTENRTPMQEHLVEGALYAASVSDIVNIHFTVSNEHRDLFEKHLTDTIQIYEERYHLNYNVSFSEQKPSTDTIAGDESNQAFRDKGELVFRPGGHGALIENLNDLDADIVFIKNIDNVVPDSLKNPTVEYKKLIAGLLVETQKKCFDYLQRLETSFSESLLLEIQNFLESKLCIFNSNLAKLSNVKLKEYLFSKLNRPIRVCGMVKNAGEPGGGPFLTTNSDGTISLQILESSQINTNNAVDKEIMLKSTHFNPVDLVCAIKNYKGEKFNLLNYVDKKTGFISIKSKNGKQLKALELPGLWNGAMSDWNTIFVEVPIETFNPVKTVNDLLRKEHQ